MRRKRRTKYTWLPSFGTSLNQADPDDVVSGLEIPFTIDETALTSVSITPLTNDQPREGNDLLLTDPLSTVIGNEYFLKRIVGKIFLEVEPKRSANGDPSTSPAFLIGCGFFVARANDTQQNADSPIGSASVSERQANYSPLSMDTTREPWIWRRTWILGNPAFSFIPSATTVTNIVQGAAFPPTNAGYGSMADGPHIDARTARRIKQDERLWFAIAGCNWPLGSQVDQNGRVFAFLDYRLLGALRKAKNSGAF